MARTTVGAVTERNDDDARAKAARDALVAGLIQRKRLNDPRVAAAMGQVPRQRFVDAPIEEAYRDRVLPIGHDQTISQPSVVARMTEALALDGSERVLEIGTGSGYQAAVLSALAREVFTIEIIPELGEMARARLASMGIANVHVRVGDGFAGWPEEGPFDRILLTAAPHDVPPALVEQLRGGGILIAPVGEDRVQRLVKLTKTASGVVREDLGRVRFVPMTGGP
jgi:protein-L-isoaspartate(D-aspartate) O-methyltransferase